MKTRLLVDTAKNKDSVKRTLEEIMPSKGDFTVKLTADKITVKPYLIIDREEIYVSTRKKPLAFPCLLWTNSKNVISIYEENLRPWNSSQIITMHQERDATEKRLTNNISKPQRTTELKFQAYFPYLWIENLRELADQHLK